MNIPAKAGREIFDALTCHFRYRQCAGKEYYRPLSSEANVRFLCQNVIIPFHAAKWKPYPFGYVPKLITSCKSSTPTDKQPKHRSISMDSEITIQVDNLSKCYQIYDKPHQRLLQMVYRGHRQYYREFWALKDVSFTVKRGETVGIIGRNGSGKSTLLQMICGTLTPTSGNIQTRGRIAALLELGSGFNPEFTGRENVYMNGAILGLKSEEVDERFSSIYDFAEIGDFIEQPVKTYSSGMMVRLAFAVAINVDPEILIVDEALAVGDEKFQRKCFSRIEYIKNLGATILFVSHSIGTILELCDTSILIDRGEKISAGNPKRTVGDYQKLLYSKEKNHERIRNKIINDNVSSINNEKKDIYVKKNCQIKKINEPFLEESYDKELYPSTTISYDSHGIEINSVKIMNKNGNTVNNLIRGRRYFYKYEVFFKEDAYKVRCGMMIKTTSGIELGGAATASDSEDSIKFIQSGSNLQVEFSFICSLNPGIYFLNAGVVGDVNGSDAYLHRLLDIAMFRVLPISKNLSTGIIDFECNARLTE